VTYYLRSTVLDGQVIEELNSSGTKQKALIYGGQKVIGYDWANGSVSMLHEDPSGLSVRSSVPHSAFVNTFTELDPWGAEVFMEDPYLEDPEFSGGRGESGPVYGAYGDISMPSTGCTLDGVYTLCDFITRNREAIATVGGKTKQTPIKSLLGVFAVWVDEAGKKLENRQTKVGEEVEGLVVTNIDEDGLGHWELINVEPQNQLPQTVIDIVNSKLANPACIEFGKRILNAVSTRDNPVLNEGDLQAIFREFLDNNGQLTREKPSGSGNWGSPKGLIRKGNPTIFSKLNYPSSIVAQTHYDATVVIGELFHFAGEKGFYTDRALAEAVRDIPEYAAQETLITPTIFEPGFPAKDKKDALKNPNHKAWSTYFHHIERMFCRP
jgi:hypothetical protein